MALTAVLASDVPIFDQVPDIPTVALSSSSPSLNFKGLEWKSKPEKLVVVGHRGKGMNALTSPDPRFQEVKENSLRSFCEAARFPVDFIEFDVQVTKDGCPIIFHDDSILTRENGTTSEKLVTDLSLEEFLSYGPQKDSSKKGKLLLRKTNDGRILNWNVQADAPLCTLPEVFHGVDPRLGFNVEIKFKDHTIYNDEELTHTLRTILQVVRAHAKERPIIFSSFQPDAVRLIRELQNDYPVFFLTDGGQEIHKDPRRNSLDEAIKLSLENGLQGVVSEVKAVFKNPAAIARMKEANLVVFTYGKLNNVTEVVRLQQLMGISGVIVDMVQEITEAVSEYSRLNVDDDEGGGGGAEEVSRPKFSQ